MNRLVKTKRGLSTDLDQTYLEEFKRIALALQAFGQKYGVPIQGFHGPELPHFSRLSSTEKSRIVNLLKVFLETFLVTEGAGARIDRHDQALWHALSCMKFVPPQDLLQHIAKDDVIEVYTPEGLQIWRNLNFMKICSYTLEEMYCIDWPSRYDRAPEMTASCLAEIQKLLSMQTPDIYPVRVPAHRFQETCSSGRFYLEASHEIFARLANRQGEVVAWLATSKVEVLDRPTRRPPVGLVTFSSTPSV